VASVTIDELMSEVLALDPTGRAHFAHRLLDSLDQLSEAEVEQLWLEVSLRRHQEVASGAVATVSVDEALAKARAARR
jgi:hypothetical protein